MDETIAAKRLTYFTFFWALSGLLELGFHNRMWLLIPTDQIFVAATIYALCFPNTLAVLVFLAGAGFVHLFLGVTTSLNNISFESLIDFTILMVAGLSFVNRKAWGIENKDISLRVMPLIRLFLIIFYFFAFFTKLNTDFLDPNYSCAVKAMDQFLKIWFGPFQMPWPKTIAIYGTLLTEFSLPVMLIFKKTRNTAIIIGLCFHFVLGFMVTVWGFSMLMGVLYFVFLSDQSLGLIQSWGEKLKDIFKKILPNAVTRILAVSMMVYISLSCIGGDFFKGFCFWLVLYSFVLIVFIFSILLSHRQGLATDQANEGNYFLPRPIYLLVFVLPLLVDGFSPFLGLRTQGCITIFTNIRTLGPKPNHLIIGPSLMVFKQGLVRVLDSNSPYFQYYPQNHELITEFEFRRVANLIPGSFYVRCIYQGKEIVVQKTDNGPNDHPLLKPIPWWEQKFIRFIPVDDLEHCRCQEDFQGLFPKKMIGRPTS